MVGSVQGVGFRWFVHHAADALGLTGWVANAADGSVRVVAEGSQESVDALVDRLRAGPPGASVRDVHVDRLAPSGEFASFSIRSGAHRGD